MRSSNGVFLSVVLTSLAVFGSDVLASDVPKPAPQEIATAPAAPLAEAPASPDNDRIVCTRERSIGSNRVQKICRKASEMATLRGDTQGAIRNNTRPTGQFFEKN
ncbi:hypothetical protein [Luteimonas terrae]|uniref:Starvation-inducible protein n=1 Tax=Luteimonas terrae TaxID=1530191 RepID=A0A4R5U5J8_9GAMM|nr:hypothetical protein [Luteimonas terrae]TDK29216.1 hypothetical protein E2F49_14855 [Luteimonas terrae]